MWGWAKLINLQSHSTAGLRDTTQDSTKLQYSQSDNWETQITQLLEIALTMLALNQEEGLKLSSKLLPLCKTLEEKVEKLEEQQLVRADWNEKWSEINGEEMAHSDIPYEDSIKIAVESLQSLNKILTQLGCSTHLKWFILII